MFGHQANWRPKGKKTAHLCGDNQGQMHGKTNEITRKLSNSYLLKIVGDEHKIYAAETQLG